MYRVEKSVLKNHYLLQNSVFFSLAPNMKKPIFAINIGFSKLIFQCGT